MAREEEVGIEFRFGFVGVFFKEVEAVARVEIAAGLGTLFATEVAKVFPLAETAELAVKDRGRVESGRLGESNLVRSVRLLNELMMTGSRMSI